MSEQTPEAGADQAAPQFNIQRIFSKNISFETPNSPDIFKIQWKPEVQMDIDTKSQKLEGDNYEVVLSITVTAKVEDKTAFLVEVEQAGIFTITNLPPQQMAHTIGSMCPGILFPYAREAISNLVNRGTFPPLNLAPVNFDALFASYMQQVAQQQAEEGDDAPQKLDS
ncbi:protein-export chaperone SecB [Catenovulum maritimum]|uniref:Protein-export protein SecB n=1 Tax=Catenovulum maritimum TaxID=1513271 RepID=A0A0J8GTB5_9ALTE|nr:protein-export chaperone SecB [Catenovulum maritimum]KMT64529.1 preprotein translocase subunit SecB [Catenovulum maritimum]